MTDSRFLITKCYRNSWSCKNASLIAEGLQPVPEIEIPCRYMLTHLSVHLLQLSIRLCILDIYIHRLEDLCSPPLLYPLCPWPHLASVVLHNFAVACSYCYFTGTIEAWRRWRWGFASSTRKGLHPTNNHFANPCFSRMEELGVTGGGRSEGD